MADIFVIVRPYLWTVGVRTFQCMKLDPPVLVTLGGLSHSLDKAKVFQLARVEDLFQIRRQAVKEAIAGEAVGQLALN